MFVCEIIALFLTLPLPVAPPPPVGGGGGGLVRIVGSQGGAQQQQQQQQQHFRMFHDLSGLILQSRVAVFLSAAAEELSNFRTLNSGEWLRGEKFKKIGKNAQF